jgi:hypothetical protein
MARKVTTKRLSSGKYVDLQNLTVEDVDIKDISQSLNYIYRFTGHYKSKPPLTVAQHTRLAVYLSTIVFPNDLTVKFDVLLHDFPEYITGDIATPLKYIFGPQFKDYEHGIEKIVYEALWKIDTPFTHEIYEQRKICDLLALNVGTYGPILLVKNNGLKFRWKVYSQLKRKKKYLIKFKTIGLSILKRCIKIY